MLARVYAAGVHGIYVGGTTGEGPLQSAAERKAVIDAAVAYSPAGKHVMIHVGASSPTEAIDLAAHAARAGAHAISSLPPLGGSFNFDEIRDYYHALGAESALPLVVYYFPQLAPALATRAQLTAICELPNVAGFKFTDFDLFTLSLVRRPGLAGFNGRDEVLAAGLLMGADGGIGTFYNLVPELFVKIYDLGPRGTMGRGASDPGERQRVDRVHAAFPAVPRDQADPGMVGPALRRLPAAPSAPDVTTAVRPARRADVDRLRPPARRRRLSAATDRKCFPLTPEGHVTTSRHVAGVRR